MARKFTLADVRKSFPNDDIGSIKVILKNWNRSAIRGEQLLAAGKARIRSEAKAARETNARENELRYLKVRQQKFAEFSTIAAISNVPLTDAIKAGVNASTMKKLLTTRAKLSTSNVRRALSSLR